MALKRLGLPPEMLSARPKRLRFEFFGQAGRLVSHARRLTLRVRRGIERLADLLGAWRTLLAPA